MVSIPHWFDSTQHRPNLNRRPASVSIPHWFDSTPESLLLMKSESLCFNPTLVRVNARKALSFMHIRLRFQSHTGSIQRYNLHVILTMHSQVSIPHWFDSTVARADGRRFPRMAFQSHTGSI